MAVKKTDRFLPLRTIRTKLILLGIGSVLSTALAMVIVGVWQGNVFSDQVRIEAEKIIDADLDHITESVYNLIRAQDESIQQKVNHDLNVARYILNSEGEIHLSEETTTWIASNQYTKKQNKLNLPKMMVGDRWLNQNELMWVDTPIVDKVKSLVGGTATIFQRINKDGDILRVATNVEKRDGKRAIGTYIPAKNPDGSMNPVVSTIMNGKTYRGIAYVVNAWYITAYEPIYDQEGYIIGVLYVGVKQENIESLRQAIMQILIGKTGYVFILGGKGENKGHYIISKMGRRDGENIWESKDAKGQKLVQSMIKKALTCKPGTFATERYAWKNPDETSLRWKIARLSYYEPWDWVIGTSVYEDELQDFMVSVTSGYKDMVRVFGVVAAVLAFFGGIIAWIFSRKVTTTLSVITNAATKLTEKDLPRLEQTMYSVIEGNLSVKFRFSAESVEVTSKDELGVMAQAFTKMNLALVNIGDSFTKMVANLRELTDQLEKRVEERTSALLESERRMADIIDFLPDATLVIDQNGQVTTWNRAMENMTSTRAIDMIGKADFEYAIPFYGERRSMLINLVLSPRETVTEPYKNLKMDGNILLNETCVTDQKENQSYIFETASALYDTKGNVIGAIEILRDITEQKNMEVQLRTAMINALICDNLAREVKRHQKYEEDQIQLEKKILDVSENERQKIGMELHDGLGHDLLEISMKLGILAEKLDLNDQPEASYAEDIETQIKKTIKKNRRIAKGLFPVDLKDNTTLVEIIEECKSELERNHNIQCRINIDQSVNDKNIIINVHLYHIIHEAIRNIIKHSQAENVKISIKYMDDLVSLRIKDNGIGFINSENSVKGMGLNIMQYRARLIGARLAINGAKNSGTEIECKFSIEMPGKS